MLSHLYLVYKKSPTTAKGLRTKDPCPVVVATNTTAAASVALQGLDEAMVFKSKAGAAWRRVQFLTANPWVQFVAWNGKLSGVRRVRWELWEGQNQNQKTVKV